jgi:hypothetical protein
MRTMGKIVGIVGHGEDKFNHETKKIANNIIYNILNESDVTGFSSGHSPVGGIDIWAEEMAEHFKKTMYIFEAKQNRWDSKYGFKQRNLNIAETSDILYVIIVRNYIENYGGRTWFRNDKPFCYHCERNKVASDHVKSGACWTAWEAKKLEKEVFWYII